MWRRRRTCEQCGRTWSADAAWCGRCGAGLDATAQSTSRRSWSLPGWVVPVALVVGLATAVGAVARSREAVVAADAEIDLPAADPTFAPAPAPSEPAGPRCTVDGLTRACVAWTIAVPGEVLPVATDGIAITSTGTELVGTRTEDGRPAWEQPDVSDVVWLYAGGEDEWALAVEGSGRLHVVEVASGALRLTVDDVRPVFPGVVDDRLAVIRSGSTEVHDLVAGEVVATVPRRDPGTTGRLVPGGFVSWNDDELAIRDVATAGDAAPDVTLPLAADVDDVTADDELLVVTHTDGSATAVDRTTSEVRWTIPTGPRVDAAAVTSGDVVLVVDGPEVGVSVLQLLDGRDGTVRHREIVPGFVELLDVDDDLLVLLQPERGSSALWFVAGDALPDAAPNTVGIDPVRWRLVMPTADPSVVLGTRRVLVGGDDGARLVDLATGSIVLELGSARTEAVSVDPLVVWNGDVLSGVSEMVAP